MHRIPNDAVFGAKQILHFLLHLLGESSIIWHPQDALASFMEEAALGETKRKSHTQEVFMGWIREALPMPILSSDTLYG